MKRFACIIMVAVIVVSGLVFVVPAQATTVGGTLNDNTHWTLADSPVTFNRSLTLAYNATLTIDPGVTVNMGSYSLTVYGTLIAAGASGNQISFTSTYTNTISFSLYPPGNTTPSSASIIQNAVLTRVIIQIFSESPTIDSCTFSSQNPYGAVISINSGSPVISNNILSCSSSGSFNLITVSTGSPQITGNTFQGNYPNTSSNDILIYSGSPIISNNKFDGTYQGSSNHGITVNSGSGAAPQISNNQFNGDGYLTGILDQSAASFTVLNNVFSRCSVGIEAAVASTLTVTSNSFVAGTDGIDIASGATVSVTNNLIDGNSHFGIDGGCNIRSNTISNNQIGIHNPPSCSISDNNIVGNTVNSITATSADVDASNNWWGITDVQTINRTIYDRKVDPSLGTVSFVPFLTAPSQDAPPIPSTTPTVTAVPTQVPEITPTPPPATPTPTPYQYSQTFIYQVGRFVDLNFILKVVLVALLLAWIVVILGYTAKNGISKIKKKID